MGTYADLETLLAAWLKTTLGYVNVLHEVPTNLFDLCRTNPVIVVDRFGGSDQTITFDVARLDVDVFANSRDAAKSHGETIRRAMRLRLPRTVLGGTTHILKVETVSAPTVVPYDSRNVIRRTTAAYQIHAHQFTGV